MYIKGYYGYKNIGDEILLLGLLKRIETKYSPQHLYIEAGDPLWLEEWLGRHDDYLGEIKEKIIILPKKNRLKYLPNEKLFGGGEVFTDARKFPYNGRNYLVACLGTILFGKFHIAGGVGTLKHKSTDLLYRALLGRASSITVRESYSYTIASKYNKSTELYHDFALDFLDSLSVEKESKADSLYVIVNVNKYIWTDETKEKIKSFIEKYPSHTYWFVPGAIGSDDLLFEEVKEIVPTLQYYDRTTKNCTEIASFFAGSDGGIAARLHVLLLLKYFDKQLVPLVYQEKVRKIIGT